MSVRPEPHARAGSSSTDERVDGLCLCQELHKALDGVLELLGIAARSSSFAGFLARLGGAG